MREGLFITKARKDENTKREQHSPSSQEALAESSIAEQCRERRARGRFSSPTDSTQHCVIRTSPQPSPAGRGSISRSPFVFSLFRVFVIGVLPSLECGR